MTLANLNTNETKRIKRLLGDNPIKPRLLDLGFYAGNSISIICEGFGTTLLQVGDSRFAVTTNLLEIIEIED